MHKDCEIGSDWRMKKGIELYGRSSMADLQLLYFPSRLSHAHLIIPTIHAALRRHCSRDSDYTQASSQKEYGPGEVASDFL